ncbi:hypothetical protein [Pseudohongiella spirulinae]|uniref:MaoC-like domain-containing protein n=1 Tax=Pseudohongiella spirulinae TaxID=1249552 RepID=A0A0S2KHN0_9GAMM|nr:hypothetical protein [Pseudohongiella spirulinae]ALO47524.1 hypothetical protein PS2015_2896 [Pseudohongiella spirulinae]
MIGGVAYNQVPDSDNRIHSDELAREYGFSGALVPGVTVSAYLMQPAIEQWGIDWLNHGHAHVVVTSPLYDEAEFEVHSEWNGDSYSAELNSDGKKNANAIVSLKVDAVPADTARRGDPVMPDHYLGPQASYETMLSLQDRGCMAKAFLWSADHEMARYFRSQADMPALLRTDDAVSSGGFANMSFILGCANRHFAAVASMNPWVHLETRSQNFEAVPLGTQLISEMRILELFSRKGHEFADCQFNLFRADNGRCVCAIEQRAIYSLRPPGGRA